jgi:Uma2 family endonuclease
MAIPQPRRRFTVAEYERMGAAGILGEDDRVELIDGEIVEMSPIGREHAASVDQCADVLRECVGPAAIIRVQGPIQLGEHAEPQPDIALLRRRPDFYRLRLPHPEDILLLVEVADSSLNFDRRVKTPLYADAGIADFWLANLVDDLLLVHRDPGPGGYRTIRTLRRGESVAPLAFPDRAIRVSDVLGDG